MEYLEAIGDIPGVPFFPLIIRGEQGSYSLGGLAVSEKYARIALVGIICNAKPACSCLSGA